MPFGQSSTFLLDFSKCSSLFGSGLFNLCKFSLHRRGSGSRTLDRLGCLLQEFLFVRDLIFRDLIVTVPAMDLLFEAIDLGEQLFGHHLALLALLIELVALRFERTQTVLRHFQLVLGKAQRLLCLVELFFQHCAVIDPKADIRAFFALIDVEILFRFLRFSFQRSDTTAKLTCNIGQTHKVIIGGRQLFLRLVLFIAVFGNAGCFFKNIAAIFAFARKDLADLALSDDRIAVTADTRIHKQLVNILETNSLTVNKIFTLTRTIVPSGHGDLIIRDFHAVCGIGIVKSD